MSARTVLGETLDIAMNATVVPGFSRIGYSTRHALLNWDDDPAMTVDLHGRVAVVTGATSGLGAQIAMELAARGARVWLVGRNARRAAETREAILAASPKADLSIALCDLAELRAVDALINDIRSRETRLDALIHNGGALVDSLQHTSSGLELTAAVHVVAPFRLTQGLLGLLSATPGSRVVTVSSGGMYTQALSLDELVDPRAPFDGVRTYANAKRAQVVLNREWHRRHHASTGIGFHTMHPGWADTPGVREALPAFHRVMGPLLRSAAQGADTAVWLAAADVKSGLFWSDRRPRRVAPVPRTSTTAEEARALWDWVTHAAGTLVSAEESSGSPT